MLKSFITVNLALCLCMGVTTAWAQQPDKKISFDKEIETILLNPYTGSVIVKDKDALQSYNPESNTVEWKVTDKEISSGSGLKTANRVLGNLENGELVSLFEKTKDNIEFIEGSPFVVLNIDNKDVIVNSISGKVVLNSSDLGYRIMETNYIPDEKALLIIGINSKEYSCVYYDLEKGSERWASALSSTESFMKSLKGLLSFKNDTPVRNQVFDTNDAIYATINGSLYKLDKADGKIRWNSDFKLSDFYLSDNGQAIVTLRGAGSILSSKMALNLLDANTGAKLWKDDISTKYVSYMEDAGDKILVAHASGFNFYSYKDGKKVWKKDAKGNKIKKVIPVGDDYLYVADKEMNLIDKNGQNKWKKFIEICDNDEDEVYYLGLVDNNRVFYLTDSYGNMVDYASGKKIWKKNIEFDKKRPLLYSYDENNKVFLVYNDKKLYKFDPNADAKEKPEAFAKLKEIKNDKTMSGIELFDWGVALVGQDDVIGVSFEGETKYHRIYKEPGLNKRRGAMWGQFAANLGGQVLLQGGAMGAMKNAAKGEKASTTNAAAMYTGATAWVVSGDPALERMKERFNGMQDKGAYAFVLNKNSEGKAELVKVRKIDGEEVVHIPLDSAKPMYEVDDYNSNIYYAHGNELRTYSKQ